LSSEDIRVRTALKFITRTAEKFFRKVLHYLMTTYKLIIPIIETTLYTLYAYTQIILSAVGFSDVSQATCWKRQREWEQSEVLSTMRYHDCSLKASNTA